MSSIVDIILVLISLRVSKLLSKQAMSRSYHQGKSCGPCYLCGKVENRYDHFSGLLAVEGTNAYTEYAKGWHNSWHFCRIGPSKRGALWDNPKTCIISNHKIHCSCMGRYLLKCSFFAGVCYQCCSVRYLELQIKLEN